MLSVLFLLLLFIYLLFSSLFVELFKRRPLAPPLFILHSSLRWEAKLTCIVDPSRRCKYSSNIHLPHISPRRCHDKIKRDSKGKFAALNHDLREEVVKFYFHIFVHMVCLMEEKKNKKKKLSSFWLQVLDERNDFLLFLNRQISTLCCIFTVRTIKHKVLASQFAKLQLIY